MRTNVDNGTFERLARATRRSLAPSRAYPFSSSYYKSYVARVDDTSGVWLQRRRGDVGPSIPGREEQTERAGCPRAEGTFRAKLSTLAADDANVTGSPDAPPVSDARKPRTRSRSKMVDETYSPCQTLAASATVITLDPPPNALGCGRQPFDAYHLRFAQSRAGVLSAMSSQ
jgi:hypothetical protein